MKIAIKGLIGSGKTTTAEYLNTNYGAFHYNCDKRVKAIYASNKDVIRRVTIEIMGEQLDTIDTKALGNIVFNDEQKLRALEQIIYPYIGQEIEEACESNPIVLLDCQQIDKMNVNADYIFYLKLEDSQIIERVKIRDNRDRAQTKAILEIQKQQEINNSNYTIVNNGSLEQLYEQIDKIMEEINE